MTQGTNRRATSLDEIISQLIGRSGGLSPRNDSAGVLKTQAALKDPQSAAGAALGKVLKLFFDDWKNNYDERGKMKEVKQVQLSEQFKNQYGDQAGAVIQDLKNKGIWDRWDKLRQFDPSTYGGLSQPSEAAQQAARQAVPLPNQQEQPQPSGNWLDKAAQGAMPIDMEKILGDAPNLNHAADEELWNKLQEIQGNPFSGGWR